MAPVTIPGAEVTDRAIRDLRAAMQATGSSTVSVLIDPTIVDPLAHDPCVLEALERAAVCRVDLPRMHDDIDSDATPYLLHVSDEPSAERVVNATLALAASEAVEALEGIDRANHGRSVCAWILGESPPRSLANRLADAARVIRPDGLPWVLRYWDPRVLWHLPRVMPPILWSNLQHQLGQWWALDSLNRLVSYSAPAGSARPEDATSMHIESPVWDRLARIGWTNTVLNLAFGWGVMPTAHNANRVERLIARCSSLGFASEQDALVFAACGLTSHDRFDEHPKVAAALTQSQADGGSVQSAISSFNEDFWSEIASSRWVNETSGGSPT